MIQINNLQFSYPGGEFHLKVDELEITRGDAVAVSWRPSSNVTGHDRRYHADARQLLPCVASCIRGRYARSS